MKQIKWSVYLNLRGFTISKIEYEEYADQVAQNKDLKNAARMHFALD